MNAMHGGHFIAEHSRNRAADETGTENLLIPPLRVRPYELWKNHENEKAVRTCIFVSSPEKLPGTCRSTHTQLFQFH